MGRIKCIKKARNAEARNLRRQHVEKWASIPRLLVEPAIFILIIWLLSSYSPAPASVAVVSEPILSQASYARESSRVDNGKITSEFISPSPTVSSIQTMLYEELQKLSLGQIVFYDPKEMVINAPDVIEALVIQDATLKTTRLLEQHFIEKHLPQGDAGSAEESHTVTRSENIRVSTLMKMALVPQDERDFKVEPLHTSDVQPVSANEATSWSWRITPLRAGQDKKLELKVIAMVEIPGSSESITKDLPEQTIIISVKVGRDYYTRKMLSILLYVSIGTAILGFLMLLTRNYFLFKTLFLRKYSRFLIDNANRRPF